MQAARERLRDVEVDRLVCEREGDPRADAEILTDWVVVTSHLRVEGDGSADAVQVTEIRSDGLSYWSAAGLLDAACRAAQREPWDGDEIP